MIGMPFPQAWCQHGLFGSLSPWLQVPPVVQPLVQPQLQPLVQLMVLHLAQCLSGSWLRLGLLGWFPLGVHVLPSKKPCGWLSRPGCPSSIKIIPAHPLI